MTAFIELTCKIPSTPIKKAIMLNIESIRYFAPNNADGSKTILRIGDSDYLVADENYEEVQKKIVKAYYGTNQR